MENEKSQIKVLFGFVFFFLTMDAKGLLIYFIHYQLEKNPHVIGSENLVQLPDSGINSFLAHEKESSLEIWTEWLGCCALRLLSSLPG